uniref:Uncharacterized protein n=1 Tax=Glossina morsitans morsitans TaxID=37546 RepID=A0A1B0G7A2_GLOMM
MVKLFVTIKITGDNDDHKMYTYSQGILRKRYDLRKMIHGQRKVVPLEISILFKISDEHCVQRRKYLLVGDAQDSP